jgi:thioredoxin-related protein
VQGPPKQHQTFRSVSGKLILVVILLLATSTFAQELKVLNRSFPGERFELEQYLDRDHLNIVVFRSRHSASCQKLEKALERLTRKRDDLVVGLVDVDRKDSVEIDWRSPLVRQFNLQTVPYVRVFDKRGQTVSEGYEARKEILKMLDALGISVGG